MLQSEQWLARPYKFTDELEQWFSTPLVKNHCSTSTNSKNDMQTKITNPCRLRTVPKPQILKCRLA